MAKNGTIDVIMREAGAGGGSQEQQPSQATNRQTGQVKRKLVDPDSTSTEVSDSKRPRIELDAVLKGKVIRFIANCELNLIDHFFPSSSMYHNVSVGAQIHNIFFTAHTILRQQANTIGGRMSERIGNKEYTLKYKGKDYAKPKEGVHKIVTSAATKAGLKYIKYEMTDKDNWYGTAAPIMAFLARFGARLVELRLGHASMILKKTEESIIEFKVENYGIAACHHILCEGITFPPGKRSSMAQSLGPLTILLCYIRSERQYSTKWKNAAKRAFAHIPEIDSILEIIYGKPASEIKPLISELADIALITTTRHATRASIPPNVYGMICSNASERKWRLETTATAHPEISDEEISHINHSGIGGFYLYQQMCKYSWSVAGKFTNIEAAQVVFHCIFGTFKEDFGVLENITNVGEWKSREQIGIAFQKPNAEGEMVFKPIPLRRFSKLSSANQTGLLSSNYTQISSIPCFSGTRVVTYGEDFFERMRRDKTQAVHVKSIAALTNSLHVIRNELIAKLESSGRQMTIGTTKWFHMPTGINEAAEDKDFQARTNGKFFLGKN